MNSSIKIERRRGPPPIKSKNTYQNEIETKLHYPVGQTQNKAKKTISSKIANKDIKTISLEVPLLGLERAVIGPKKISRAKLGKKILKNFHEDNKDKIFSKKYDSGENETKKSLILITESVAKDHNDCSKKSVQSTEIRKVNNSAESSVSNENEKPVNRKTNIANEKPVSINDNKDKINSKSGISNELVKSSEYIIETPSSGASKIPMPTKNQKIIAKKEQSVNSKVENRSKLSSMNSISKLTNVGKTASSLNQSQVLKADPQIKQVINQASENQKTMTNYQKLLFVVKRSSRTTGNTKVKQKKSVTNEPKLSKITTVVTDQSDSNTKPTNRKAEIKQIQKVDANFKIEKGVDNIKLKKNLNSKNDKTDVIFPPKNIISSKLNVRKN